MVAVGSKALDGHRIGAYNSQWTQEAMKDGTWQQVATLSEAATPTRHQGKAALEHVQTTVRPDGVAVRTVTLFDRTTMAPMQIHQQIENGPPQAPKARVWEFAQGKIRSETTKSDGEVVSDEQEAPAPMFYGMAFGLVLAALPLEEGYTAKLPVMIPQQRGAKYWLIARVVGRESFAHSDGSTVQAWAVETDWADYDSGEITSVGGADQAGGAYYVATDPPKGFPYVPRYVNNGIRIEVAF